MKVIYVEWVDSTSTAEWVDLEDVASDCILESCYTVGYLVEEHPDYIVVSSTYSSKNIIDPLSIPKGVIKKRRFIKL